MSGKTPEEKDPFFEGKTFDDFLFRPQKGTVASRKRVSLESPLACSLSLALPIISANMDSVTGAQMAKTMALEGGLGIIHRALTIADQAEAVRAVKRSHGYIVEEPLCLPRKATLREARQFTQEHDITGILIEEKKGSRVLAGLLSNRDIPWTGRHSDRPVEEFMTPFEDLVVGDPQISLEEAEQQMFNHRIEKLPLVDENRKITGLITKQDAILFRQVPFSSIDSKGRLLVGAAIGATGDYLERAAELLDAGADLLVIDVAHGHSEVMEEALPAFRRRFSETCLICGNIGTAEGARFLRDLGADAIKVGIGPGRGCRTRLETAAGVPQLQAVREAWLGVGETTPIIADGGVRNDKDIFLALACGATAVMLGSALSGTDEAPGKLITDPGTGDKRKIYRGMTSPQAVLQALYDAGEADGEALETPPEGQEIEVPYRGSVVSIIHRIRGHVASSVSYAGEEKLEDVRQTVTANPARYLIPLSEPARRESYER